MSKPLFRALAMLLGLALAGPGWTTLAAAQGCLSQGEARQAVQDGEALPLSQLRGALHGEVLSAQLCRGGGGLVYVVSVLGEGGQVQRLQVDARSGAVAGR